jgi:hypothetical protein
MGLTAFCAQPALAAFVRIDVVGGKRLANPGVAGFVNDMRLIFMFEML